VTDPPVPGNNIAQYVQEPPVIVIGEEDLLPRIATACDVVDGTFVFDT